MQPKISLQQLFWEDTSAVLQAVFVHDDMLSGCIQLQGSNTPACVLLVQDQTKLNEPSAWPKERANRQLGEQMYLLTPAAV